VTWFHRAQALVTSAVLMAALVALSGVGFVVESGDQGRIRLSWKAVGQRVEACRTPSQEELEALPEHMRRSEICEGGLAPFELRVAIDGREVYARTLRAAGAREDRPTTVYEEFPVSPGRHRLAVRFESTPPAGAVPTSAPLTLERDVEIAPREILLVVRDEARGELEIRQDPNP